MSITNDILKNLSARVNKPEKVLKEEADNSDNIQVFMNTWNNYNEYGADEGSTPTGWMTPEEGLNYCKKYADYEPFINDVDNCPFEVSEYDNASQVLERMIKFNNYEDKQLLKNAMETEYFDRSDVDSYIEKLESGNYVWFPGVESEDDLGRAYIDMVGFEGISNKEQYFDEDTFKESIYADERAYYANEHGIDEDSDDFPESDFEDWLDELVDERSESYEGDAEYFDYERLGRDLTMDGYTFTSDGCIQIM